MATVGSCEADLPTGPTRRRRSRRTAEDDDLLAVVHAIMRISLQAADQLGSVSVTQVRALTVLHGAGRMNLAQLAAGMGVTVSTTSRLVDRLVAAGLVDRRTAPHNGREIALRLTSRGRATLDRYDELRLGRVRGCVESLPQPDRELALRALRALVDAIEADVTNGSEAGSVVMEPAG